MYMMCIVCPVQWGFSQKRTAKAEFYLQLNGIPYTQKFQLAKLCTFSSELGISIFIYLLVFRMEDITFCV